MGLNIRLTKGMLWRKPVSGESSDTTCENGHRGCYTNFSDASCRDVSFGLYTLFVYIASMEWQN